MPLLTLQKLFKRMPGCLCSEEEFDVILKHERARADRNGQIFSLIVFNAGNREANSAFVRDLLRMLVRRLRSTDEVGWMDKQRIGVILPGTPAAGARIFADTVRESFADRAFFSDCAIYTYPDDKQKLDNANKKQGAQQSVDGFREEARHTAESMLAIQPLLVLEIPVWKRCMDIVGAFSGLLILSPILFLIALIIKIVSPGPVFFKQERIGYGGKPFVLWKFRTMRVDGDTSRHQQYLAELINSAARDDSAERKPMIKMDNDPRIIPCGMILRKSCLDELPQLINVLRGEMSLVGPRPPIPYEVEEYLCWYKGRLDIVPGMTGLWQVSGKNQLTFKEMVRLDIQYAKNISFWFDMKILFQTPVAIMSQIMERLKKQKIERKGVRQNA